MARHRWSLPVEASGGEDPELGGFGFLGNLLLRTIEVGEKASMAVGADWWVETGQVGGGGGRASSTMVEKKG